MAEINQQATQFANPSATIGLTPVNGVAATALRSDAAPALSQSIVPTWTGVHTFSAKDVHNAGISLGVSGVLETALPSAALAQYAFDFVDTIDRSANATNTFDIMYRLRNSTNGYQMHFVTARGEHVFGLSGQASQGHILSFIQDTFTRVGTATLNTGILGQIAHNSTNTLDFHDGIIGAWVHSGGSATYTDPFASGVVGVAHMANDISGLSSQILTALRGQLPSFASITGLHGFTKDNAVFVPGDWEMVTPCYLQGNYFLVVRRGAPPTNQADIYCGIRVPLMDIGNTTDGDSAGVYIENTDSASSGWSGADRCFAIRIPFPNDAVFDYQAHMFFTGSHVGTGGYAAPAGGPPFDELGGVYFDDGTNNPAGLHEYDGSNWKKLISVATPATYTPTNVSTDRSYDADSTTVDELADIVGTLISDLQSVGVLQ